MQRKHWSGWQAKVSNLFLSNENVFGSNEKRDGNCDNNRDFPSLHFVETQYQHDYDYEQDDIDEVAGDGLEFRIVRFSGFCPKF